MSTQTGNPLGSTGTNPPPPKVPWVEGIGFALKMEALQKGEVINLALENTSSGTGVDKNQDSVVIGPYRPNGQGPYTSVTIGSVAFQIWGSSTGDPSIQDISVPIYRLDINPQSIQIVLASNFTTTNAAVYYMSFYVWYKASVNDLTMHRSGGKTGSSILAWWVDGNGDYNDTATNFNTGKGDVEYPIHS